MSRVMHARGFPPTTLLDRKYETHYHCLVGGDIFVVFARRTKTLFIIMSVIRTPKVAIVIETVLYDFYKQNANKKKRNQFWKTG